MWINVNECEWMWMRWPIFICTVISGRLPAWPIIAYGEKKEITDYPHWWITRTLLFNFFGSENVTLRRYISVFQFRHAHNSLSILAYTLLIKLYSKNTSGPYPNLNISYLTECEFMATFCASDCSAPCWFVERKLGQVLKLEW